MTTSATKIVSATSKNNNNNNHSSNNSNTNSNSNNSSGNSDISTTNNNRRNTNKQAINNLKSNDNQMLNVEPSVVVATTSHTSLLAKENFDGNLIMRNVDIDLAMDVKEQQDDDAQQDAIDEKFPLKIENLSMGIKMPLNMTTGGMLNASTIPSSNKNNNNIMSTTLIQSSMAPTTRAMQSDEDFNIRFVNLVRNHKCLYDKKVPEYRNRDNQEKAWSLISHETRESVIHCKERWRNLRACLSRYIKQQSGSDPQHKPYYLTEHMSFLLPFLKSTRNGVGFPMEAHPHHHHHHQHHNYDYPNSNNHEAHQQHTTHNGVGNLSSLFQIQQQSSGMNLAAISVIPLNSEIDLTTTAATSNGRLLVKHSLSENDDEETIDAFDPAITSTIQQQQQQQQHFNGNNASMQYQQQQQQQHNLQLQQRMSPALSDTASANSMQHFIPDIQLSEAPSVHDHQSNYNHNHDNHHHHNGGNDSNSTTPLRHEAKRIKLESNGMATMNGHSCNCADNNNGSNHNLCNNSDMEFFRSILPDIVNLTAQQKRKLKIGILELIDDVVTRYPPLQTIAASTSMSTTAPTTTSMPMINSNNKSHRNFIIHERRKLT